MTETQNLTRRLQKNPESEGMIYHLIPMIHLTYELCSEAFDNTINLIHDQHLINEVSKLLESGNVRYYLIFYTFLRSLQGLIKV